MDAHERLVALHPLVIAVAVALTLSLLGCGAKASSNARPTSRERPPLPAVAVPGVVLGYFFEDVRRVDAAPTGSIAFWLVETDTTPTASAALAALAFMGQQYANQGRAMVLRIDVTREGPPGTKYRSPSFELGWNPTDATVTTGLSGPDDLSPHSLAFGPVREGMLGRPGTTYRLSQVASETLLADSPAHRRLLEQLRATGLR